MKKLYLILILFAGLNFTSSAQTKDLSTDGPQQKLVKFYPNPAYNFINFDFEKGYAANYTLVIFNFIGKPVYESKNISSRNNVPLNDFFRGIYIFQLRDKNGTIVQSGKFQVVK